MHEAFWNGLFDVRWEEAPLGPEAIRLIRRLRERGYAERTCRDYGHAVVHLGRYLHEERESGRVRDEGVVADFLAGHLPGCRCYRRPAGRRGEPARRGLAHRHRLHALWRLIATRGLRRGEGCGLRRPDTDLAAALTTIRWQITQLGSDPVQGAPKSDAGERTIALDADTVTDITAWRQERDKEKEAAGDAWIDSGFEFTDELGNPLHPAAVTDAFHLLAYLAGLPPIRLHDLRHGAATLLLAAGHDMKVVQETLGLSSITIAADTYTSVLPQLARRSAEDVAALIRPAAQAPAVPGRRRRGAGAARKPRGKAAPKSRPAGR